MDDPFETFVRTAFRLETRPRYQVEGDVDGLRAFREGRPPPMTDELRDWVDWLGKCHSAGRRVYRCHVVDQPLTEYMRYELAQYRLLEREGNEEIWLTLRNASPELSDLNEDFWAFDLDEPNAVALRMNYDVEDRYVDEDVMTDPATLARYRVQRDVALAHALSLEDFASLVQL